MKAELVGAERGEGMSGCRRCFLGPWALLPSNKQESPESLGFCTESSWSHRDGVKGQHSLLPRKYRLEGVKQQTGGWVWCVHVLYILSAHAYVCPWWFSCVCVSNTHVPVSVCVCRSDRVNPAACESELFMLWKPWRASMLRVTNETFLPERRADVTLQDPDAEGRGFMFILCFHQSITPQKPHIMHRNINDPVTESAVKQRW